MSAARGGGAERRAVGAVRAALAADLLHRRRPRVAERALQRGEERLADDVVVRRDDAVPAMGVGRGRRAAGRRCGARSGAVRVRRMAYGLCLAPRPSSTGTSAPRSFRPATATPTVVITWRRREWWWWEMREAWKRMMRMCCSIAVELTRACGLWRTFSAWPLSFSLFARSSLSPLKEKSSSAPGAISNCVAREKRLMSGGGAWVVGESRGAAAWQGAM